ncbi:MAG: hydantoinase/oxoprolinase family protein [Pseudomonadota bacterium]
MRRVGIDVGGTHTDAVLMDGDRIVATTKRPTTADIFSGTTDALDHLLDSVSADDARIEAVMLGTTQFTNAVVERRELQPVSAVRIGLPSGEDLPPFVGWPEDLAAKVKAGVHMLDGGWLYDGSSLAPMDSGQVNRLIDELGTSGTRAVCLSSVFAPLNPELERRLAESISAELPDVQVSESYAMGQLGLLERENAALLNASLLSFAGRVVDAFVAAIAGRGLDCPFYISQNDGTLMTAEFARNFPALTFASGPTNSLRGACKLTGVSDAIVVDIGGTTSDVGVLQNGFPRESNTVIEVGGVRTNFRMPDILALGLGGGSEVSDSGHRVGPQSVGHRLMQEGLVFGGDTLTATDIVVAAGLADVGTPAAVSQIDKAVVSTARATMRDMLNHTIEQMRPSRDPLPVILVGGGAILVSEPLAGASETLRPEHADVANAIGAAIAQVGGESESLVSYDSVGRDAALKTVTAAATKTALAAGAAEPTLRVADIQETPIAYMSGRTTRLRVKVIGDIDPNAASQKASTQ